MKKRVLSLLLVVVLLLSLLPQMGLIAEAYSEAYAVEGGNIYFDKATGTITDCESSVTAAHIPAMIDGFAVTCIGENAFWNCFSLTSVTIPNSVITIGDGVFTRCSSLTSVTIPNSVTTIGEYAFHECENLTSVTIPNSVITIGDGVFSRCSSLTSVTIPNSVTTIGDWAFEGCRSLTSVTIPNSVTTIGDLAFESCSSLTSVTIPNSVTTIGNLAFFVCSSLTSVTIPNSVTTIGEGAFRNCSSLTSVTIPNSVTTIGEDAFRNCSSLTSMTILNPNCSINNSKNTLGIAGTTVIYGYPGSTAETYAKKYGYSFTALRDITATYSGICGDNVEWSLDAETGVLTISGTGKMSNYTPNQRAPWYTYRTMITSVIINDGVTTLGDDTFSECDSLTSVSIPGSVTILGSYVFAYCDSLTSIMIPDSVTTISAQAFLGCGNLMNVTIPDSVIFVGDAAFSGCDSLISVTIPNSVITLGDYAFCSCTSLTSVSIGNGVREIGEYVFSWCETLPSITIPNNVTSIGKYAFFSCTSLTSVTILNSNSSIYNSENTLGVAGTTVIYGYPGSTAENYAKKYGYSFTALGDTGGDGTGDTTNKATLTGPVTDEMMHLIFADMAYAHIPTSFEGKTVDQWLDAINTNADLATEEMKKPIYKSSDVSKLDVYRILEDWTIASVETGKSGYAAVVFKKGSQIIIAYRGSEDGPQSIFAGEDWTVDMQFALFNYLNPDQFEAALNTYSKFEGKGNITLTGHSLGGALTTYVSTLENVKGYAFDGACGHVVDLTYLQAPLNIDFTDTADMHFANYTDPTSLSGKIADLIQHTSEDLFPGVCYTSNPDCINYFGTLSFAWTHQIFSNTRLTADGRSIEFMPIAETHNPTSQAYASVDYELLRGGIRLLGNMASLFGESADGYTVKNGNLWLGTAANDSFSVLTAFDNPRYITSVVTANVLYGGDGCDTLSGAATADVLVPNELLGDTLAGKLGSDHYILDCRYNGSVYITDNSGVDRIYLRNVGDSASASVRYSQLSNDKEWHIYRVNETTWIYIKSTLFRHEFTVLDEYGEKICTIDTKGSTPIRSTALRATVSEMAYKEVYVEGESTVRLYDENNNVVGTYSLQESGLYTEDFGTVEVGAREETVYLSATIPESYHARVTGDDPVYVSITGTDTEGHVNRVTHAEDLDLYSGEVEIIPEEHSVLQNGTSVATSDATKTVRTEISKTMLSVDVGDSAQLTGKAFFADGTSTQDIYWLSSDPSIAKCEYDERGQCTVTGMASGEATVYAVARDSGVTVECKVTVSSKELVNPFSDVKESDYYYDPVLWAVDKGITNGTGKGKFSPENPCTRGQIVTFLWRACGSPEPMEQNNPFSDVSTSAYYYKAVLWAVENGITNGTGKGKFSPDDTCTRGQVATFLWRAQGKPAPTSSANPFNDVSSKTYYYDAVLWAVEKGVTNGTGKGRFSPDDSCTRGQIVTFLYRALS